MQEIKTELATAYPDDKANALKKLIYVCISLFCLFFQHLSLRMISLYYILKLNYIPSLFMI